MDLLDYKVHTSNLQGGTMTETAERVEDRLADFTRDKRILLLSLMAVIIGAISALVAKVYRC